MKFKKWHSNSDAVIQSFNDFLFKRMKKYKMLVSADFSVAVRGFAEQTQK